MAYILIIVSLSGAGCAEQGEKWVDYSYGMKANNTIDGVHYYDAGSMTRPSKHIVRAWEKKVFTEEGGREYAKSVFPERTVTDFREAKTFVEVNCATNERRVLTLLYYNSQREVVERTDKATPWIAIREGQVGDLLRKSVCKVPPGGK